jgi:hypothetical protein
MGQACRCPWYFDCCDGEACGTADCLFPQEAQEILKEEQDSPPLVK